MGDRQTDQSRQDRSDNTRTPESIDTSSPPHTTRQTNRTRWVSWEASVSNNPRLKRTPGRSRRTKTPSPAGSPTTTMPWATRTLKCPRRRTLGVSSKTTGRSSSPLPLTWGEFLMSEVVFGHRRRARDIDIDLLADNHRRHLVFAKHS